MTAAATDARAAARAAMESAKANLLLALQYRLDPAAARAVGLLTFADVAQFETTAGVALHAAYDAFLTAESKLAAAVAALPADALRAARAALPPDADDGAVLGKVEELLASGGLA